MDIAALCFLVSGTAFEMETTRINCEAGDTLVMLRSACLPSDRGQDAQRWSKGVRRSAVCAECSVLNEHGTYVPPCQCCEGLLRPPPCQLERRGRRQSHDRAHLSGIDDPSGFPSGRPPLHRRSFSKFSGAACLNFILNLPHYQPAGAIIACTGGMPSTHKKDKP